MKEIIYTYQDTFYTSKLTCINISFYSSLKYIKFISCNFSKIKYLGKGTYGKVYISKYNSNNIAIKTYIKNNEFSVINEIKCYEFQIKNKLVHNNIVNIIGYTNISNNIALILEYCEFDLIELMNYNTTRNKYIKKILPLYYDKVCSIMEDVRKGLEFLHSNYIAHLDIKPDNILIKVLDNKILSKICDFGFAMNLKNKICKFDCIYGTYIYAAPEIINNNYFDYSADIYSFGMTMKNFILSTYYTIPKWIYSCLEYNPAKRPIINNIYILKNYKYCIRNKIINFFLKVLYKF